jgi:hypothetical protein
LAYRLVQALDDLGLERLPGSTSQRQVPISVRPSCSAKSLKSLMFKVARGRS